MSNQAPAGHEIIADFVKTLPGSAGVYRMLNKTGDVLYVGKARNLKKRVSSYTVLKKHPIRIQRMIHETASMEFITTHTEAEALLLEAELIKKLKPRYNILLRDDKSFPYIMVTTDHDFPQVTKHRGSRGKQCQFYGPFASVGAVNHTLTILQKAFMLRNCSDAVFASRSRPCLQYQIKRCTAPCVGYASQAEYREQVDQAIKFLSGESRDIQTQFAEKMECASEALDFETAAKYRDRIRALTSIQTGQVLNTAALGDADVIAVYYEAGISCIEVFFYRGGHSYGNRAYFPRHEKSDAPAEILGAFILQFYENKPVPKNIYLNVKIADQALVAQALSVKSEQNISLHVPLRGHKKQILDHATENARQALKRKRGSVIARQQLFIQTAEVFELKNNIERIEIYDNSHIQGAQAIGAMVVATKDGFSKNQYRKFNIKDSSIWGDDYAMMREVLMRRFGRAIKEDPDRDTGSWPDLVIIDGGQGQLNAACRVFEELGISGLPVIAIAKGPDRNAGRERFFMPGRPPFTLPVNDPVMHFMQRLRDESHRFAIGSHRLRRKKETLKSALNDIHGIGAVRKKALLAYFGSARAVKDAGISELMKVDGISEKTAKIIYDSFHE